ncbi:putative DNA-directed RNA polymerases I; II; and III subunit RPABC1 [Paratrimastix pyriformis]|uniref:DNA-directed RNA polymerases I n=1 Tax=Paratrimastix pyriformis TaxID=342808 RepID=A0ABQ8UQG1_9EUKA|nr:putative DNA-directed RNA polymerases I; II; and III subunit RPABC1 [Paratrimastix pyriformis]
MATTSVDILFRVFRTLHEMLHDRGYLVSQADLDMTLQEFKDKYGDNPSMHRDTLTIMAANAAGQSIFVFFPQEPKVGVAPLRAYFDRMIAEGVKNAIVVVQDKLSSFAKQSLVAMAAKVHIEQFLQSELLVNITRHALLLEKYKVKETQLPRIQLGDPVVRYFGLVRGQVVKIIRPSETAGRYITYRLVS